MKISGIYIIKNTINGREYIGQSNDVYHRFSCHRWSLKNGVHENEHLQRAWNKYGENAFTFNLLEEVSVDNLDRRETEIIEERNAFRDGYNMTKGDKGVRGLKAWNLGKHHSEETRKKLSEMAKKRTGEKNPFYNKKHTEETKEKIRKYRALPVIELKTGMIFESAKAGDEYFGGRSSNVSKALKHKCKTAYGREWAYYRV